MENHFCTCPVQSCGNHPVHHDMGCDLCIKKNLKQKEIPACFFLKVSENVEHLTDFTFDSFVSFYRENNRE